MGGKVFEHSKLLTPRMSPELYRRMIAQCQPTLETIFRNVVVPREAPNKIDHGDIDFLVEGKLHQVPDEDIWKLVEGGLAAEFVEKRGESRSYAVPHPDILNAYVQIDIELSPGNGIIGAADLFEWMKFMKGDADLLQIIGIAHRPLGLTCNNRGLHVRVEQIEPYDKKKALLFLTRDPDQAMQFYGFDVEKYKEGFKSETDLFDWVAAGRFFSSETLEHRVEKSADRSRLLKRHMYRHFVEDYMPKTTRIAGNRWTRQEVLRAATKTFDVQKKYDDMMATHNAEEAEKELWLEVKAIIPAKDKALSSAVKPLKRWVRFSNCRPVIGDRPIPHTEYFRWSEHVVQSNKNDVLGWVALNWQAVKSHDRAYEKHHGHSPYGPYSSEQSES
ncbi:hypothetical protein BU25DRAFT_449312 [Macroventuria anomochaeta]|uniref:Uncharacterized protein n=1 Tax=Macroventuria anomochaeta TaxID=301207 RepID=A0ACB6RZL2_9PLEO|nr:uncharacterized protein BU25DRAFT_449312 [Macroventuria anomochaeta]KAF2626332.1 hypothetical protein BU25DRAFT_449312 [Macroventuria anomochaeta]